MGQFKAIIFSQLAPFFTPSFRVKKGVTLNPNTTFPFTQKRILKLKATNKSQTYSDKNLNNLKLTVTSRGSKTYYARFKSQGQPHNIKVGNAEHVRLDEARARVIELINHHRTNDNLAIFNGEVSVHGGKSFTVDDAFKAYFHHHLQFARKKGKERHSLESNYTNHLKQHLGHFDIRELNRKFLAKLLKQIGNTKSYAIHNKCVTVLKAMFNYCLEYEDDYPIEFDPAQNLKKLSSTSRSRYLTLEEAQRLIEALTTINHPTFTDLFLLALFTGARISNVKAMRWEEVIFHDQVWIVPAVKTKTNKTYCQPLSAQALIILKKRYKQRDPASDFVFPSPTRSATGHVMGGDKTWKEAITAAGLYSNNRERRIRQHDLRRTFATWQALNGVDINTISKTLGHSDIKNTQIYAQINLKQARESINQAFSRIAD